MRSRASVLASMAFANDSALASIGLHYLAGWPRAVRSNMVPVWSRFPFKSRGYASGDAGDADDRGPEPASPPEGGLIIEPGGPMA